MSVIQKIRDKYARWAVVAIALSLLGFILMDAFAGRTGLFGSGQSSSVGKIDGSAIPAESFRAKVSAYQRNQQGEQGTAQAVEQAWNDAVDSVIMGKQYEKLGLTVSDREIAAILFSQNAPQEIKQIFTNPQTGIYDPNVARQQINNIKKQGSEEQKTYINALIDYVERQTLMSKYTSLLANTINYPKWFLEKLNVDNSLIAKVAYVSVPYSSISDSTVKVSDKDIQNYIDAHRKQFEQKEEMRSVSYVAFSAAPSAADSQAIRNQVLELKPQFDTTSNYETFIARNSTLPFYDGLITRSAIQQPNKDSILAQPVGVVYGPYLDPSQNGGQFVLSKIISSRNIADTASVRHILIATSQQTEAGMVPVREDSAAKRLADSIATAHRNGANFDSLVVKFSEDPGSKDKGGVYEDVVSGRMVASFNDFVFTNPPGTTGVVKTDFGYHYIEVLSTKGSSPAYKIAYLGKPIVSSDETENAAQNAATLFAGNSRDEASFNENWEKDLRAKGVNKLTAADIKPLDYSIQGVNGTSRKMVREIFEADKGDIIGPERVGDSYVVALVTDINKAGVVGVARARQMVEPVLRNKKKAEEIKKKIGTPGNSLEAVATKLGQQVIAVDSLRFNGANNMLGYEPKVTGAAFNPANKGKVVPEAIAGQVGVYVLRVDNTSTVPVQAANIQDQKRSLEMQARQGMLQQMQYGGGNPFVEPLKKSAKIKDNRAEFY